MFVGIWKKLQLGGWLQFAFLLLVLWFLPQRRPNNVINFCVCLELVLFLWFNALVSPLTRLFVKKLRQFRWSTRIAKCGKRFNSFYLWFKMYIGVEKIVGSSGLISLLSPRSLQLIFGVKISESCPLRIDPGNVRNACGTDISQQIAVPQYTAVPNAGKTTIVPNAPKILNVLYVTASMTLTPSPVPVIARNMNYAKSKKRKMFLSLRPESWQSRTPPPPPLQANPSLIRYRTTQPEITPLPKVYHLRLPVQFCQKRSMNHSLLLLLKSFKPFLVLKKVLQTKLISLLQPPQNTWVLACRLSLYLIALLLLLPPQAHSGRLLNQCPPMTQPLNVIGGHRILQWNINGVRTQQGSLYGLLSNYNPSIVALQETCLKSSSPTNLTFGSYSVHRQDRDTGSKGGVALMVRSCLPQIRFQLPKLQQLEAVAVKTYLDNRWVTFISLYDPHGNAPRSDFDKLLQIITTPIMIMGDFNAHHPLWGDTLSDTQGVRVSDWFIDQDELSLLNDGSLTRLGRNANQRDTAIDLTFASSALALLLRWRTLGDYGSDHVPILIESCLHQENAIPVPRRWLFAKADWRMFRETLLAAGLPELGLGSVEAEVQSFTSTVYSAATASIPRSAGSIANGPRAPPWWNKECAAKLKEAAVARRRAARTKNHSDHIHARKLTAIGKLAVRDAKQRSWRSFCTTKTSSCTLGQAWNTVRWFRTGSPGHTSVPPICVHGQSATSMAEAASSFAEHFKSTAYDSRAPYFQPVFTNAMPAEEFTMKQLTTTLRSLKNTAPGADGITGTILKNLPDPFLVWLLAIYNRCWREGIMPEAWKSGIVLAFLKPGKDPTKPESYRPITLLSVLGKLLERLIKSHLEWHLESKGLRYSKQTGFRKGRRSIDNVIFLNNVAKKALMTSGACLAVFLDIRDAFGSARHTDILQALHKLGVHPSLYNFVANYLSDRTARVRVGTSISDSYVLTRGVPQGAVLSPLLFSILLDDLASALPHGLELLIYADDIVLFATGNELASLNTEVQNGLEIISELLNSKGLELSPTKCHVICFTRKHRIADYISLQINDSQLPLTTTCRYLGVTFDQRLTWRPHIDSLHTQSTRLLSLLRAVTGSSWGADRSSMRMFYIGLIRSRLDYAAAVYRDASQTNLQRLTRLQNAALRLIVGTPRSTSIAAMELETFVPPLDLHRDRVTLSYYAHCRTSPVSHFVGSFTDSDANYNPFKASADSICRDWGVADVFSAMLHRAHSPVWPPWNPGPFTLDVNWLTTRKADLAGFVTSAMFQHHLSTILKNDMALVFTDGSVQPQAEFSGFAFHIPHLNITHQYKADPYASICRVELSALVLAIMWLMSRRIYQAVICADSISALQIISSVDTVDPLLCALYRIMTQHPGIHYHLLWVPSHVGVPGNEVVDLAAKNAVHSHQARFFSIPPDPPQIKRHLVKAMMGKWQDRWRHAEGGRFLHSIQPTVLRSVIFDLSFPRRLERLLALARVNRFPTLSTLARFNLSPSSLCASCLAIDTLEHRFASCTARVAARMAFHEAMDDIAFPRPSRTLMTLLSFQELPSPLVRSALTIFGRFLSRI